MNDEQADKVKGLAAPVNKVLEGLKVKCPECKGKGLIFPYMDYSRCKNCKGKKKIKYKWQPKVGEWCIDGRKDHSQKLFLIKDLGDINFITSSPIRRTPILPWEECFEILVKAGFSAQIEYTTGHKSFCTIKRPGLICADFGSNPTGAVYKTILRLGKKLR